MPSEPNVDCFCSHPRGETRRELKFNPAQTTLPAKGVSEGAGRRLDTPLPLQLSHSLRHQRPGPRCHVPASVHPHILWRPSSSLPCRRPWWTTPQTRAAREQLERLEQLPQAGRPKARPRSRPAGPQTAPGPGRLPRDRPRGRRPGPAPSERPLNAGSPPTYQKRIFAATRPTSPLCWPNQARPAAQLRSPLQP